MWLVALLSLTSFVYWPGLSGQFIFDDIPNIVWKEAVHLDTLSLVTLWDAWSSGHAGPLKRPIAMVSFALNHLVAGLDPWSFKLTNLVIHLGNGLLLFALARLLFLQVFGERAPQQHADHAALLAAALWLLHPFNLSPVLYVVQRMTLLAALFTLAGLTAYAYGRRRGGRSGWAWIGSAYLVWLPLAALSKENGLLLPALLAAMEFFIFRFRAEGRQRRLLYLLHGLAFLLPAALLAAYSLYRPQWFMDGYANRDFTLAERLLTEARVLWRYLSLTVVPDISRMGLFHEVRVSTSLWQPWTTLPAVLGLGLLAVAAWLARHQQPLWALAIAFFLLGHSMESSIIALELMHEHRNYLPSIGLAVALAALFRPPAPSSPPWRLWLALSIIAVLAATTAVRAHVWGDTRAQMLVEAANHPGSASANYEAGRVLFSLSESVHDPSRSYYQTEAKRYFEQISVSHGSEAVLGLFPLLIMTSSYGEAEEANSHLRRLRTILNSQPLASVVSDYLKSIGQCQHRGHCRLTPVQVWSLFEAALANPHAGGYGRSLLLIQAARYAWYGLKDHRRALELATEAAAAYPASGCHRIDQILILHALGATQEAQRMLALARQAGTGGCMRTLIELEQTLDGRAQTATTRP